METNRGKRSPKSTYIKSFQLRDDFKKVFPLITVNTTASLPQKEELKKLETVIMTLNKELQGSKTTTEILTKRLRYGNNN
jgi:hypothetical protein